LSTVNLIQGEFFPGDFVSLLDEAPNTYGIVVKANLIDRTYDVCWDLSTKSLALLPFYKLVAHSYQEIEIGDWVKLVDIAWLKSTPFWVGVVRKREAGFLWIDWLNDTYSKLLPTQVKKFPDNFGHMHDNHDDDEEGFDEEEEEEGENFTDEKKE